MTQSFFRLPHLLLAALPVMCSFSALAQAQPDYTLSPGDAIRVQVIQTPGLAIEIGYPRAAASPTQEDCRRTEKLRVDPPAAEHADRLSCHS